jgi:PAS domain S-box-containing protein
MAPDSKINILSDLCSQIADAVPHIIWKIQTSGSLEYNNRLWLVYSGLTIEQSLGFGWQSISHPQDLEKLMILFSKCKDANESFSVEFRLKRHIDNSFRWHMLRAVPELSGAGLVCSWIITNTDIDDQKKIEQDLIKAKELSVVANQAKSAFLANMSHEIRTPLGIVLGYADLLASPNTTEEKRLDYLGTVKRSGELLSRLIGDILDLSKIEAGHMNVEKVHFSLPDFLQSAMKSFQNQSSEKNIKLNLQIIDSIPVTIFSDPMRLQQILFNIVSNAIKFTNEGEIAIFVDMETKDPGCQKLKIAVQDQGFGITLEQASKIFQPFNQLDNSTTRKYGGTGLGLSLSRKLARQLGGDVVLSTFDMVAKGSTFFITLSTGDLSNVMFTTQFEVETIPVAKTITNIHLLNGVKILIVEDAPENQFLLKHFLTGVGATVATAENGQEGVRKAMSEPFDLILMDIQMPILDGYQATQQLRQQQFKQPILALTAYALKEERERCIFAGCNDHLTKPINRDDLISYVAKYTRPITAGLQ